MNDDAENAWLGIMNSIYVTFERSLQPEDDLNKYFGYSRNSLLLRGICQLLGDETILETNRGSVQNFSYCKMRQMKIMARKESTAIL